MTVKIAVEIPPCVAVLVGDLGGFPYALSVMRLAGWVPAGSVNSGIPQVTTG
jgi:hypothetical protein